MMRTLTTVLAGLALLATAAGVPAAAREVVFLGFGGTHEKNMRERVLPSFRT